MTSISVSADPTVKHGLRYDIQALRGLAIALVLIDHAALPGFPGGFLGVDIFFVISGFLMTGLIDEGLQNRTFTLKSFYIRRIRRLFPASYATLAVTAVAAPFLLDAFEYRNFVGQLVGAFTFTANFFLWNQTDYFGSGAALKPLLHTWSLSIEEQFYLVLPVLMMLLPMKRRLAAAIVLAAVSLCLCLAVQQSSPSGAFYLLPFRAWELGFGSVVALLMRRAIITPGRYLPLRLICAAILIITPMLVGEEGHPGLAALLVCLATAVLLVPGGDGEKLGKLLRPMTWIGDRSYSLYLVHWPLFAFANNAFLQAVPLKLNVLLLAICFVWAEAQYRWVEQPFRRFAMTPVTIAFLALSPAAVIGLSLWWSTHASEGAIDRTANRGIAAACAYGDEFTANPVCQTGPSPKMLIWGDSFAMQVVPGILASSPAPIVQATRHTCGPFLNIAPVNGMLQTRDWGESCIRFNASVLEFLKNSPSVETVVLSSSLVQYLPDAEDIPWQTLVQDVHGAQLRPVDEALLVRSLQETTAAIRALGKKVVLVAPPPSIGLDMARCLDRKRLGQLVVTEHQDCRFTRDDVRTVRGPVIDFLASVHDRNIVPVLDVADETCGSRVCNTSLDGTALYRDHTHLSIEGSALLGKRMGWGDWIAGNAR